MENIIKRCPYDGKKFVAKRSNQIYSCNTSRIAFHNRKNKQIRNHLNRINNKLLNNYMLIRNLIGDDDEIIINNDYLKGRGFSFKFLTHIITNNNFSYYGLYEYAFYKESDNETKFFINGNN